MIQTSFCLSGTPVHSEVFGNVDEENLRLFLCLPSHYFLRSLQLPKHSFISLAPPPLSHSPQRSSIKYSSFCNCIPFTLCGPVSSVSISRMLLLLQCSRSIFEITHQGLHLEPFGTASSVCPNLSSYSFYED